MDYFKHTRNEIAEMESHLNKFVQIAVEEGINPDHVNPTNAAQKISKRLKDFHLLETKALELGYASLPNALKALQMFTDKTAVTNLNQLPEVFHTIPHIWLYGKTATKRKPGIPPLSRSVAERKYRVITPLLLEAWQLTDGDEKIQDAIIKEYLTSSADDFEKALYCYIHDLEEITLEEEFSDILPIAEEDISESLRLATDPNRIYGVVKKNEE